MDKEDILREILPEWAARRQRDRELQHARDLAAIAQTKTPTPQPKTTSRKKKWKGNVLEFAHMIEDDFNARRHTPSRDKAFELACRQWEQLDGSPFLPDSLRGSLAQERRKLEDGNPRPY